MEKQQLHRLSFRKCLQILLQKIKFLSIKLINFYQKLQ